MKPINEQSVIDNFVKHGYNKDTAKCLVLESDKSGETHFQYVTRIYGTEISVRFACDILGSLDWNTYNN